MFQELLPMVRNRKVTLILIHNPDGGCKPKPAEFIQHLKSILYCKFTLARMASRSIGCCLSRNA
jgi:hypothetical protein